ncbi:MAG: hypothetical protein HQL37_14665 [Alphaproteobacteria bacterium]|nr:hypothetical protein [Alphaproteobacteria bacterium]
MISDDIFFENVTTPMGHIAYLKKAAYYGHICRGKPLSIRPTPEQIEKSLRDPGLVRESKKVPGSYWYSRTTGDANPEGKPWFTLTVLCLNHPPSGYVTTALKATKLGDKGPTVWSQAAVFGEYA